MFNFQKQIAHIGGWLTKAAGDSLEIVKIFGKVENLRIFF